MKYIFITGGVVSSLGKGLAAASLGTLLELRGLRVVFQKFDPYLNVDPGTMNPFQHGEVYVLNDGADVTGDQIIVWCKENLAAYKTPARVDIVKELPKSATGKILKRVLREQAAGKI